MLPEKTYSRVSATQAALTASALCEQIFGGDARAGEATLLRGYSVQHRKPVRQWDVVCDTTQGQYLVRVNADSGHVFAINEIGTQPATSTTASRLSRAEAEVYGRRYLGLMGTAPKELRPMTSPSCGETYWCFRYRAPASSAETYSLSVLVDVGTGRLVSAWNGASNGPNNGPRAL